MAAPDVRLDMNTGSQGTPTWTSSGVLPFSGTGVELRWSDSGSQTAVASASWPAFVRPASGTTNATTFFLYYFSADTTGNGIQGGGTPVAFANANYNQLRWSIQAGTFTFASAPILTAYDDSNHNSPAARSTTLSPVFPNNLSGSGTASGDTYDSGATNARSYLKANAYGVFGSTAPAAAPGTAPVVTIGTNGSVSPAATPAWLGTYQGLMADVDYITVASIPTASTAAVWYFMLALFSGANMATGTYVSVCSLKFTYS